MSESLLNMFTKKKNVQILWVERSCLGNGSLIQVCWELSAWPVPVPEDFVENANLGILHIWPGVQNGPVFLVVVLSREKRSKGSISRGLTASTYPACNGHWGPKAARPPVGHDREYVQHPNVESAIGEIWRTFRGVGDVFPRRVHDTWM